jgi:hypothetical protein
LHHLDQRTREVLIVTFIKSPDDVFTYALSVAMKSFHQTFRINPLFITVIPPALIWSFAITVQAISMVTANPSFLVIVAFNLNVIVNIVKDNREILKDCRCPWSLTLFSKYGAVAVQRKRDGTHIRLSLLAMLTICPMILASAPDEIANIGTVTCLSVISPLIALLWFAYAEASEPPIPHDGNSAAKTALC